MTPVGVSGEKSLFQNIVGKGENAGNHLNSIKDRNYHLCYIYSVVYKHFQFGQGQIFVIWEWAKP